MLVLPRMEIVHLTTILVVHICLATQPTWSDYISARKHTTATMDCWKRIWPLFFMKCSTHFSIPTHVTAPRNARVDSNFVSVGLGMELHGKTRLMRLRMPLRCSSMNLCCSADRIVWRSSGSTAAMYLWKAMLMLPFGEWNMPRWERILSRTAVVMLEAASWASQSVCLCCMFLKSRLRWGTFESKIRDRDSCIEVWRVFLLGVENLWKC